MEFVGCDELTTPLLFWGLGSKKDGRVFTWFGLVETEVKPVGKQASLWV